jgi:hypothetical protein
MNAAFFGLACLAALNPKLLVIDLILAKNRRPRAMFLWFLLGGVGVAVAFGLIDVLVLHIDAIKTQNHLNGGIDLGLGIPLLVIGLLLATGLVQVRTKDGRGPLTWRFTESQRPCVWSGRRDLNPRPLDPQGYCSCVTRHQLMLTSSLTWRHSCALMSVGIGTYHRLRTELISAVTTVVTTPIK